MALVSGFESRIADEANIKLAFLLWGVSYLAEGVEGHYGLLVSLLAPEDVIDPGVQIIGHILRLNSLTHHLDELESILICPSW